jgi:hypothetical protein
MVVGNFDLKIKPKDYYVYIYFDTRKSLGYTFGKLKFKYKPFYVGMGKRRRVTYHIQRALFGDSSIKAKRIRRIIKETGKPPKIKIMAEGLTHSAAYQLEISLILSIGRKDMNLGPLFNKTNGGSGTGNGKGVCKTTEHCQNISKGLKGKKKSLLHRQAVSAALLGKPSPKSQYIKSSKYKPATLGRKHTVEERKNISFHTTGSHNPNSKLTEKDVLKIRTLLKTNTQRSIATMYGVSQAAIKNIHLRKSWKHL